MDVFSIATQKPAYMLIKDKLIAAVELMAKRKFRRLPVVSLRTEGENEELIGIITANDVIRLVIEKGMKVLYLSLEKVMVHNPIAVVREESLGVATEIMASNGFGALPIINDEESLYLCGIVTERDIVKAFVNSIADATLASFIQPAVTLPLNKSTMKDVFQIMHKTKTSRVIFLDEKKTIKGFITNSDILAFLAQHSQKSGVELTDTILIVQAKDFIQKEVVTVREDQSVAEVAKFLLSNKMGGVPVVNEEGKLVGTFSERELLNMIGTFGLLSG